MKEPLIVGIDVSKLTLDIHFKPSGLSFRVRNSEKGFKELLSQLSNSAVSIDHVLVVMEHTGKYSLVLEEFLQTHRIGYCKVAALEIKRSIGVTRGKNDKVDAGRIAAYGWLRRGSLKGSGKFKPGIHEIKSLLSLRSKLVRDRAGYISRLKETIATATSQGCHTEISIIEKTIAFLTLEITALEKQIKALIRTNPELERTSVFLQSIKGVGWLIAAWMICQTENFTRFANARKFNCYAGLAPFSHESGTSIRGRSRVSHLANKEAKTLLNLAAFSAIRYNQELKSYYSRRVAEGKRKMSCINIVRAKIVSRMFAVVKRQANYTQQIAA